MSYPSLEEEHGYHWSWMLFLLILGAGGGFAYWWLNVRPKWREAQNVSVNPIIVPIAPVVEPKEHIEPEIKEGKVIPVNSLELETVMPAEEKLMPVEEKDIKTSTVKKDDDDQGLAFIIEPLETPIKEKTASKSKQIKNVIDDSDKKEGGLEFVLEPEIEEYPPIKSSEKIQEPDPTPKPIKSKAALDTLLGLANAYIGMEDYEAAGQYLEEILEHGNDKQKREVLRLLKEIRDKK